MFVRRSRPSPAPVSGTTVVEVGGSRPRSVAGYRLVRKLGEGDRAEVFLAVPLKEEGDGSDRVTGNPQVAIKIGRPGLPSASLLAEADALTRARHPHLLRLIDVAGDTGDETPAGRYLSTTAVAPCLVIERLPRGTLAHLLADRRSIGGGEAVTILVPIIEAIAALHAAGAAHGRIGPAAIQFRDSGAPVLCRFGAASLFAPGLPPVALDDVAAVAHDRVDLVNVVTLVLGRVESAEGIALVGQVSAEFSGGGGRGALDSAGMRTLVDRIFALAPAEPIDFRSTVTSLEAGPTRYSHQQLDRVSGALSPLATNARAAAADRIRRLVRRVRPRVLVTGTIVAAAMVAVLLSLPSGKDAVDPGASTPSVSVRSSPPRDPVPPISDTQRAIVSGDDPRAALVVLLALREVCVSQLSESCFVDVDQRGSGAMDADTAAVRELQAGTATPRPIGDVTADAVRLVQRLGDSALLSVGTTTATASSHSKPVPILIMRTETGWRIRDYLEE